MFVDGHKTHLTYPISKLCTDLKIILIALYPNATRILQPADVSCFRPLKALWKHGVLKWRRNNPFSQLTRAEFAPILNEVISDLVPESISNGFRACGLCPWNVNAVDFTKCLGKQTNEDPRQDVLPTTSMSFDQFIELVGPTKFEELRNISLNELDSFSEDFQILHKIYRSFCFTENAVENIDLSLSAPDNDFQDDGKHLPVAEDDSYHDIEDNTVSIQEAKISPTTTGPDTRFTEEEIMDMPILISTKEDDTHLNDNISNYLLWQRTPERSGKRNTEKIPYVITSTAFKNICEEKVKIKDEIAKQKAMKKVVKDQTKLDRQQNKGKQIKRKKKDDNDNATIVKPFIEVASPKINVLSNILLNNVQEAEPQLLNKFPIGTSNLAKRFLFQPGDANETAPALCQTLDIKNNILMYSGLCFICVTNIYKTKIGIKCKHCSRSYHYNCLLKKNMYKSEFVCPTCNKSK